MTDNVKVKLKESYGNEFITLNNGDVVYKKDNDKWTEIANTPESRSLIKQGILIKEQEEKINKTDLKNEIKDEIMDEKIIKDNENKKEDKKKIKEIKTQTNNKEIKESKEELKKDKNNLADKPDEEINVKE